jgi:putative hydrolase of the HAD superfamily
MMDNHHIKAVIFDLGNVWVDFNHRIAAEKVAHLCHKPMEEIFALFFDSGLTGLFEEGKITPDNFFQRVKEMLALKIPYAEFLPIWNDIFFLTQKNRQVHALARELKNNYKLGMISNINVLHFSYLQEKFPIFDLFPQIVTSYAVGVRKPAALIYEKALQALGVLPQEAFYIDDRPELIQGAQNLGIYAVVLTEMEKLKSDLKSCGVGVN